jgi:6-pyruvoyl-tetrahydropterin synthase
MNDFDVIIGNFPYGNCGQLAVDFLIKSSFHIKKDGLILEILPNSVRKTSVQNKIIKGNPYIYCVNDVDCDEKTFPQGIHASIQSWKIGDVPRAITTEITTHPDFEFLNYENRHRANLVIIRTGNAGKMYTDNFEKYLPKKEKHSINKVTKQLDHYFVNAKDQSVIEILLTLEEELIKISANTNGRNHVSKGEICKLYERKKEQTQSGSWFFS